MRPRIGYIGDNRHDRSITTNLFFDPKLPSFTTVPSRTRRKHGNGGQPVPREGNWAAGSDRGIEGGATQS